MQILLDTNVLLRVAQRDHPQRPVALVALNRCRSEGHHLVIVPQNLYEFWVVSTRPADQNGLGLAARNALPKLAELLNLFTLLRDERTIFDRWYELIRNYSVEGKSAHDTRLVAAMIRHGIKHLEQISLLRSRSEARIR